MQLKIIFYITIEILKYKDLNLESTRPLWVTRITNVFFHKLKKIIN